jgi:hypothetical protein
MTLFEFLMMIAAVVVAVGMTEIVGGWGRLMRTRAAVEPHWLHLGWTIAILVMLIGHWVGMWSYKDLAIENVGQIMALVVPSVFCVLAAYAITPDVPLTGTLDMREYYITKRAPIFLPLAAFLVATNVSDIVIAGADKVEFRLGMLAGPALLVSLAVTKRIWVHGAVLGALTLIIIVFMSIGVGQIGLRFDG